MQHANQAIDEVRRAELFRKGGRMRGLVKGKRWLLLSRWRSLSGGKRRRGYKNWRYLLLKAPTHGGHPD